MSSDSSREVAVTDEPDVGDREATDVDDAAEATDQPFEQVVEVEGKSGRGDLLPKRLVLGAAALALAAFIVAAVFGVLWFISATGDKAELASARQSVVGAANEAVQAITEVDYRHPEEFIQNIEAISTKKFAQSLSQTEKRLREALSQAKTSVRTDVLDVAVQELNDHEGTATFLAVIKTNITQGDKSRPKLMRLQGKMKRVSAEGSQAWKLSDIGQVPVVGNPAAQQGKGTGKNPGSAKNNGGK